MFDLKKSIEEWKLSFSGDEAFTKDNIEELESHLTDQIVTIKEAGLSDEEAFWIAQKRIGSSGDLSIEYEKVNSGEILRRKFSLMLIGFLFFSLLQSPGYLFGIISPVISYFFEIDLMTWTYFQYSSYIIFMVLIFIMMFWFIKKRNNFIENFINRKMNLITRIVKRIFFFIYIPFVVFYNFMYIYGMKWLNSSYLRIENQSIHRLDYLNLIQVFGFIIITVSSMLYISLVIVSFRKKSKSELAVS